MKTILKVIAFVLVLGMLITGCSGKPEDTAANTQSSAPSASASTEPTPQASAEKKTLTIYNAQGMGEYFEAILIPAFKEKYGDKYEIQYETSGEADVVTKIEAQGLAKGKGNINVVFAGQNAITSGNEKGLFMPFDKYKDDLRIDQLTDVAADVYSKFDNTALPIYFQHQDAGIAYMPKSEKGAILDKVVGDDGKITYDELIKFITDNDALMGRGRISKSGAGDCFSWGAMLYNGEYGPNQVPQKTIDMLKPLYQNGNINLYDGTGITFTELTEGTVDVIPHSMPWFYRLYAVGNMKNPPESIKEDTKGLENAKFAAMTGPGLKTILSGSYYAIPSNLSDEDVAAALEFIKFAVQPEMNAGAYAGIAMPAYKDATFDKTTSENAKIIWSEVSKYYPKEYQDANKNLVINGDFTIYVTDIATINTYRTAWQDNLEKLIK